MTTEDIIIHIFCCVDDQMPDVKKMAQATLYPSEVVTIGILFALKGGHFRAFCRWLKRDYAALFGGCPIGRRCNGNCGRNNIMRIGCWLRRVC